ncbi:ATP-binding protein [Streptomyces sp. CSDS2]|uniref:ATP-binding protein n=1 Tax=Streptomyces sp. CSDS2 TaxID=3055051 RepID=UPI00339D99D5
MPPGREFCVGVVGDGSLIRIEVRDSGGGDPEIVRGPAEECGGRGLRIVSALADDFGVVRRTPVRPCGRCSNAVFRPHRRFVMEAGERARLDAYFARIASRFSPAERPAAFLITHLLACVTDLRAVLR